MFLFRLARARGGGRWRRRPGRGLPRRLPRDADEESRTARPSRHRKNRKLTACSSLNKYILPTATRLRHRSYATLQYINHTATRRETAGARAERRFPCKSFEQLSGQRVSARSVRLLSLCRCRQSTRETVTLSFFTRRFRRPPRRSRRGVTLRNAQELHNCGSQRYPATARSAVDYTIRG